MNIKVDTTQLLTSLKKKLIEYNKNNKKYEEAVKEYEKRCAEWQENVRELVILNIDSTEFTHSQYSGLQFNKREFSVPSLPVRDDTLKRQNTAELERFIALVEMCTTDSISLSVLKGVDKYL